MGKPNAGMIVLPIIDGELLKMEASESGKSTIPVKDRPAGYVSHACRIASPMVWR